MFSNPTHPSGDRSLDVTSRRARRFAWLGASGLTAVGLLSVASRRETWPDTSTAWHSLLSDFASSGVTTSAALIVASLGVAAAMLSNSQRIATGKHRLRRAQIFALGVVFAAFAFLMVLSGALTVRSMRQEAEAEMPAQQATVTLLGAGTLDAGEPSQMRPGSPDVGEAMSLIDPPVAVLRTSERPPSPKATEVLEPVQPEVDIIWITTLTKILLGGLMTLALGVLLSVAEGLSERHSNGRRGATTAGA